MNYITPSDLKLKIDEGVNLTLLDVREPYELDICNIGGLHIPMAEITVRAGEIDSNSQVVVMCKSGKRAQAVANLLESEMGISDVVILEGGILKWIEDVDNSLEVY